MMKLKHMGILLTTYCNLNCRDCADLIPQRDNCQYDIDDIKRDMDKLLSCVEEIGEILLIGGETFLYPYLGEVIEYFYNQPKVKKMIITTNGTFLPSDELINAIKDKEVIVRVSGYPEFVAPRRASIVDTYVDRGIVVENLDGMAWCSMGSFEKRNHTALELKKIFATCSMKTCVAIQREGKIFFCSRQMSAYETDIYPTPLQGEYVDVRTSDSLMEDIDRFYSNEYISTCDYCDGISCATKGRVETAIQILPKSVYIDLLRLYICREDCGDLATQVKKLIIPYGDYLKGIDEYVALLVALKNYYEDSNKDSGSVEDAMLALLNRLVSDYNYSIASSVPYKKMQLREVTVKTRPNVITVSGPGGSEQADLTIDDADIEMYAKAKWPKDLFSYTRWYIKAKLSRLRNEAIANIVCGLSYTQYGIIEGMFSKPTVNLSVTGQDMPYQILMARHALALQPDISTIIMPFTYYQGYYDMASDDADIHRMAVTRVNIPILHNGREYRGPIYYDYFPQKYMAIMDQILDQDRIKADYERRQIAALEYEDYFNDSFPIVPNGGLPFDFHEMQEQERYESAKKTASLNERVVNDQGFYTVMGSLRQFIEDMRYIGKRVIIFVPPMTKYLYAAYRKDILDSYKNTYVGLFSQFHNVVFKDLAIDENFNDSDFIDFEHLNRDGAIKLTQIIDNLC